jgi:hypothetical protein
MATALFMLAGCQTAPPPTVQTGLATTVPTSSTAAVTLDQAKNLFYQAVHGAKDDLPSSIQLLDELGGRDSRDPQVVAYLGASQLLKAKWSPWILERTSLAHDGLTLEDRAVSMAPSDLEIRFLRGVTNYQLPRFLGRWPTAVSDLTCVAQQAEQAVAEGRLSRRSAAADLLYYGKVLQQNNQRAQARVAWRAAMRIDPQGRSGKDAAKLLAGGDSNTGKSDE